MESLVPYSSSSDEQEDNEKEKNKILKNLPCASSMLGATNKQEEAQNSNASLHQNRIRRFKHERGNWATYVYVPVQERILEGIPELCQDELKDLIELEPCTEFHISLSRTVVLQYHWIDNFVKALEHKVRNEVSFSVFLTQLDVYVNEEKTRTFIGFKVHSIKLMELLHKVDDVLEDFKLQSFYEDPSFHVSFAWCLGDKSEQLITHFKYPTVGLHACLEKSIANAINVNELQCKIGHKIYTFQLNKLK